MLIAIYIIGNIIAWGGIGVLLIFYKLDKIYPAHYHRDEAARSCEAAKTVPNS